MLHAKVTVAREKQLTEIRELMAKRKEEEQREGDLVVQKVHSIFASGL